MKKIILIISHGSREKSANREFKQITQKYQAKHPAWNVVHAYLELASPSIPEALESLVRRTKAAEIIVLPFFLFSARHVKKDVPEILRNFQKKYSQVKLRLAKPLGSDAKLLLILDQRVMEITKRSF